MKIKFNKKPNRKINEAQTGAFIGAFVMFLIAAIVFTVAAKYAYPKSSLAAKLPEIKTVKIGVVVVKTAIKKGDVIKSESVTIEQRDKDNLPETVATEIRTIVGLRAATNLAPKMIVTLDNVLNLNQVYEMDDRLDDYDFSESLVANTVKEGDYIDVEFIQPDGSTFIVVSKKLVEKRTEKSLIFKVDLDERKYLNASMREKTLKGGDYDIVKYLDPDQSASIVTYKVKGLAKYLVPEATPTPVITIAPIITPAPTPIVTPIPTPMGVD